MGLCQCREGFTGKYCDQCAHGFFGYPNCQTCNCNKSGSVGLCDKKGSCICKVIVKVISYWLFLGSATFI